MGVQNLWNIIGSSCETVSLDKLRDKTIAIDLAGWAVDSQCLGSANDVQVNMHLRNLFFRTKALLMQGTIPVFVLEGKPPELKMKVIAERLNIRDGKNRDVEGKKLKCNRQGLTKVLKSCEKMLELMGLKCVKAHGEAEAMCAYLNQDGLVDGCITQDGDCFLYGAKTIYRKYSLAGQASVGGTAEEYTIDKIEKIYKLGRNKLIALALLCGCDYTPGVNGIGKTTALKFFSQFEDSQILRRMKSWRYDTSAAPTKQEQAVKSKCLLVDEFPDQQVIDEFLIRKGSIPTKIDNWQRPNGAGLVEYLAEHLRWETPATFEKVLPLVTRWQVINFQSIPQELRPNDPEVLIPKEIKKKRTPQTVLCFEIEWTVPGDSLYSYILSEIDQPLEDTKPFLTIERQDHVMQSYPQLVQAFEDLQAAKKKPKKAKKLAKEPDKIEEPPKQKKTRPKKPDSSCKRIDAYFQQRKSVVSKKLKSLESQDIGKSQSSRYQDQREDVVHNTVSKLAGTLPRIFDQLNSEDFASDVDADCAEMSMIIQRTCSQTSTNLPTLMPVPPHRSALDCVPEEKPRVPSPIIRQPEVLDISSDDDFVYIPLGERLKARV